MSYRMHSPSRSAADGLRQRSISLATTSAIYKVLEKYTRWGAVCPGMFPAFAHDSGQVLTCQGKSGSHFRSFTISRELLRKRREIDQLYGKLAATNPLNNAELRSTLAI